MFFIYYYYYYFYFQRCPLDSVVLHTKQLDLGEPCALLSQSLQPPKLDDIKRTILNLKEVITSF